MLALYILSRSFLCIICSKVQTLAISLVRRLFFARKNSLCTRPCLPYALCFVLAYTKFALMLAMRILPIQSLLTSFWHSFTGPVQLIFGFSSWSYSTALIRFIAFSRKLHCFSFGSKDMITVFTCLRFYRYGSFTLRAYLCWRHSYCQSNSQRTSLSRTKWPLATCPNSYACTISAE